MVVPSAKSFYNNLLVWDQHGCLPLTPSVATLDDLALYSEAGVDFISINVGCDFSAPGDSLAVATAFHRGVTEQPHRFRLVRNADDVPRARSDGKLAVAFDLEGAVALDGNVSLVQRYSELGVRTTLLVYNRRNAAGSGCHDAEDTGLSPFGRAVLSEMTRVGMLVDVSHCSLQTSLDVCTHSKGPVIFSHSNPRALVDHERNISDAQIIACASTGGVIGINGVSIFLPGGRATVEALATAIAYVVDLVGHEHVGLGLDYVVDRTELDSYLRQNPEIFPAAKGYSSGGIDFLPPSCLSELVQILARRYSEEAVRAIMGLNFHRVANAAWQPSIP